MRIFLAEEGLIIYMRVIQEIRGIFLTEVESIIYMEINQ